MVPVQCGEVLADRYRVERLLGLGGMGAVVAARHLSLGELVAIKFMRPEYCSNKALLRRFQREARGMFRLKSEHVPRVFDLGALPPRPGTSFPVPFIVMEHLSGSDLRSIVERRGRLSLEEAAEYVRQACAALTEAHALGMVHRDLKPANLFLTYRTDGTPLIKVLDFGVAKFVGAKPEEDGLEMTTARSVMGSRRYMAPEQMLTPKDVDARADLWALGVVLYQLVSGTLPFGAETMEQLVLVVTERPPRPLRDARPDLPEGFEAIVMRCLEKDRNRRPVSASELAAALAPFALRGSPDATLPTAIHLADPNVPTFTWPEEQPPTTAARPAEVSRRRDGQRRRTFMAAAAGASAAAAAVLALGAPAGWPRARETRWASGLVASHIAGAAQALTAAKRAGTASPGPLAAAGAAADARDALEGAARANEREARAIACDLDASGTAARGLLLAQASGSHALPGAARSPGTVQPAAHDAPDPAHAGAPARDGGNREHAARDAAPGARPPAAHAARDAAHAARDAAPGARPPAAHAASPRSAPPAARATAGPPSPRPGALAAVASTVHGTPAPAPAADPQDSPW